MSNTLRPNIYHGIIHVHVQTYNKITCCPPQNRWFPEGHLNLLSPRTALPLGHTSRERTSFWWTLWKTDNTLCTEIGSVIYENNISLKMYVNIYTNLSSLSPTSSVLTSFLPSSLSPTSSVLTSFLPSSLSPTSSVLTSFLPSSLACTSEVALKKWNFMFVNLLSRILCEKDYMKHLRSTCREIH